MRTCTLVCAVVLALAAVGGSRGVADKEVKPDRVEDLIRQLGDDNFARRAAASKALEEIGEPALAALRRAAADTTDLEVRQRAHRLAVSIQDRLDRTDSPRTPAPKDAVVLFDGKTLDGWVQPNGQEPTWKVKDDGILLVFSAPRWPGVDIMTRRTFAEGYHLHAEFRVPADGNSGIYLQGLYEVQILDSFGKPPDIYSCGSIYGLIDPRVNASKRADVWQTFDIDFHPAEYKDGQKRRAARVTVVHNGVKIHDFAAIPAPTDAHLSIAPSAPGPVLLQNHDDPVQFRNLWLVPLAKR